MREKIYRAFGRALPSSGTAPSATKGSHAPLQKLDKKYIQERLREDFKPPAKECYEAALERDKSLAGKMVIEFTIVGDESVGGTVDSATLPDESTLVESDLSMRVRQSLLSMSFAPPENGGMTTVRIPFFLAPREPDAGAAP